MPVTDSPQQLDHLDQNRVWWERSAESYQVRHAEQLPTRNPTWGVFSTPEADLGVLGEVGGRDVVELGAGGAQFSIALARQGAHCTAVDLVAEQLEHAEELLDLAEREDGTRPDVTLLHANAETTGLPEASFDVAFSDYGASMFADPELWVPEAARLLRPGGRLAFTCIPPILELCWQPGETISSAFRKDYSELRRVEDDGMVVFNLPYSGWVRLFRRCGFTIVDLVETTPPDDLVSSTYRSAEQVEWARHWPGEMLWVLDRDWRAGPPSSDR